MKGTKITIILVPGLDEKIRQLAHGMTIEDIDTPTPSTIEELLSLMIPDLITDALAGGTSFITPDPGPPDETSDERLTDIGTIIQEAERRAETPEVVEILTQVDPGPLEKPEAEVPSFDQLCKMAEIHPDAVSWAKGNPSKEAALIETCISLPTNMWSWGKMLALAERTYEIRLGGKKDSEEA